MDPRDDKQWFEALEREVTRAINAADPMGLMAVGAQAHEYSPEVGTILPRLNDARSEEDVVHILDEEFVHWFESSAPRSTDVYARAAKAIWTFLQEHGQA